MLQHRRPSGTLQAVKVLLIAATEAELSGVREQWTNTDKLELHCLVSGIGPALAAAETAIALCRDEYDLVLNIGVAGAYHDQFKLGEVVQVVSERFALLGAEDRDGSTLSVFDLGLLHPSTPPFSDGQLLLTPIQGALKRVQGATVERAHGSVSSIERFRAKHQVDVESMEGAGVAYAALRLGVQVVQLRAVSNYVEARNRAAWKLPEALRALTATTLLWLEQASLPTA